MNMYVICFMGGSKTEITEEEYQKLNGQEGLIFISRLRETINLSSVTRIYPKENEPEEQDHKIGVLHDGSRVIRQFGQWFCLNGEVNEGGIYEVRPDPIYYPEVAKDCVPSVKTFEKKYQALPPEERKKAICGVYKPERYLKETKPLSIGEIVKKK